MSTAKPFLSIDNQVELLKSRGLVFSNIEKSKRYLLENNYYTIINATANFSKDLMTNTFQEQPLMKLDLFSLSTKKLKLLFLKA